MKFAWKVRANNGATGFDTMQLTGNVVAVIMLSPLANVGYDQTITFLTISISIKRRPPGATLTIVGYVWTKISGPASGTIINSASAATSVTGLVQGVYKFELKVTDNNGAAGFDTMQVTVNAAAIINLPPTANAGVDQTITEPPNSEIHSEIELEDGRPIAKHGWKKILGP